MKCEMTTHLACVSLIFLVFSALGIFIFSYFPKIPDRWVPVLGASVIVPYFLLWIMGAIWFFGVYLGWG